MNLTANLTEILTAKLTSKFSLGFVVLISSYAAFALPPLPFPNPTPPAPPPAFITTCNSCHGVNGMSVADIYPHLASQKSEYIVTQLNAFRSKTRNNPGAEIMQAMTAQLSDDDIQSVAQYFAGLKFTPKEIAHPEADIELGQNLFFKGKPEANISACTACHGLSAKGNKNIPRLAGQNATYLMSQLQWFQEDKRISEGGVMNYMIKGLTPDEIKALAHFLESLN